MCGDHNNNGGRSSTSDGGDESNSGSGGDGNVNVYDLLAQSPHKAFVETQLALLHSSKLTSRLLLASDNGEVSGGSSSHK